MSTIKEQAALRKAQREQAAKAAKSREKAAKAAKASSKKATKGNTLKFSMPLKTITLTNITKREAKTIKANKYRYASKSKERDQLAKKIANAKARGQKVLKSDERKLTQLRNAAKREYTALHTKLYNLSEKAKQTTTFTNAKGRKTATIRTKNVSSIDYVLKNRESGYARIQLLTPMLSESDKELGIGDYTTVMLEPFGNKTIGDILNQELSPHLLNEDFVVRAISVSTTTRY